MINANDFFKKIKGDVSEYFGMFHETTTNLATILADIVEKNGSEVLFDADVLAEALKSARAEETEILQVCLMIRVTGFREVVERDSRTMQVDLERYIRNAFAESGLTRETVLRIVGALTYAIGIGLNYRAEESGNDEQMVETVAILAHFTVQDQLASFKDAFNRAQFKSPDAKPLDFESLEQLVNIGIPAAKYYMGYCLLHGIQLEQNVERGLSLLQEAADAGDSKAGAALGDYYFSQSGTDSWTKAYDYYTGYGNAALSLSQRKALRDILNHKRYNKRILILCAVWVVVFAVIVAIAPATTIFAACTAIGWIAVAVQLIALAVYFLHYLAKPYDRVYMLPMVMSAIGFLYMAVKLLA